MLLIRSTINLITGMDIAQLQDQVTEISAKFQLSVKQANDWKPKLKAGTESSREFKKHLASQIKCTMHREVYY